MNLSSETKFLIIAGTLTFILVIAGVFFLSTKNKPQPTPTTEANISVLMASTRHSLGNPNSPVKIVEFADFECPACAAASPITKQVVEKNKDKVYFVYRQYPLPSHQYSKPAALASEAASLQGKFWEMHDLLFENQAQWAASNNPQAIFETYAQKLGLNVDKFKEDFNKGNQLIANDYADGNKVGLEATPTFFINGQKHEGVIEAQQFQSLIDSAASTSK